MNLTRVREVNNRLKQSPNQKAILAHPLLLSVCFMSLVFLHTDIRIERTVDMVEAHEVDDKGEEEEVKDETVETQEVDDKQEDEVTNQETVSKVGSANQRPASWSGGSRKLRSRSSRSSRSSSEVSSHHGDDQTIETIDKEPVGEDLDVSQAEESVNILDETKIPDDPEGVDVSRNASEIGDVDNVEKDENVGNISEAPDVANVNEERQEEHNGPERDGVTIV